MDDLNWLEHVYFASCDGSWEHHQGISLESLDNPGWLLKVDVKKATDLTQTLKPVSKKSGQHWLETKHEPGTWIGVSDAMGLRDLLKLARSELESLGFGSVK